MSNTTALEGVTCEPTVLMNNYTHEINYKSILRECKEIQIEQEYGLQVAQKILLSYKIIALIPNANTEIIINWYTSVRNTPQHETAPMYCSTDMNYDPDVYVK